MVATAGEGTQGIGTQGVGSTIVAKVAICTFIDLDTAREWCVVSIAGVTGTCPATNIVDTGGLAAAEARGVGSICHTFVDVGAT